MNIRVLSVLFCIFCVNCAVLGEKIVVCYYGTWATYRGGLGKFDVENINTNLCTHIIYTFTGINSQGTVISLDPYLDLADNYGRNNFKKFTALKLNNANLKTILAVGGWNEGSSKYSIMAANPNFRQNFIQSALKMILDYGFDGLDVDWEYPNQRDSVHGQADVANFVQLLKELREEFDKYGLLVTAAVAPTKEMALRSYDIPSISKYLHIISLMTYDLYGPWDSVTGHNSPLHKGEGDENVPKENLNTVDVAVEFWLSQGCPPEKLVVGIPFYGRSFVLTNPNVNGVRSPSSGVGLAGPYTATNGLLGYNELCYKFRTESWNIKYDSLALVPYAVRNNDWVSYDDRDSVIKKVEYGQKYNLGGAMVWSIETDDFHGVCGDGDYPLLKAINTALNRNTNSDESKPSYSSAAPSTEEIHVEMTTKALVEEPWVPEDPSNPICTEEGFTADPEDCTSFYICISDVDGTLVPKKFQCPANLYWDQYNKLCNYEYLVECSI